MKDVRYAGFWIRTIASFFDTLLLAVPIGVVIYFLSDGAWFDFHQYQQTMQMALSGNPLAIQNQPKTSFSWELLFELSVLIASAIFWSKDKGATPGKKICHIKIVDAKSLKQISNKQALTRSIGYIPSTLLLCFGFFMIFMRKDKRALHDLLADTVVIYVD